MAYKQFALDERTIITIYKRKASRSLRLSVTANGQIRVSIPTWVPYKAGLQFAKSRKYWIDAQQTPRRSLVEGHAIGKAHHLHFETVAGAQKVTSRVSGSEIVIKLPTTLETTSEKVQKVAEAACIRALKIEAEKLLPQRLAMLAEKHDFTYGEVSVKRLKSRWGSCDNKGNIVLNLFLMQLPWECIDYVLLHELTHTRIMRHGPDFWGAMKPLVNDLNLIRKAMRSHQPVLHVV